MSYHPNNKHNWITQVEELPRGVEMPKGQSIIEWDKCPTCKNIRVKYLRRGALTGRAFFTTQGQYMTHRWPECIPVQNTVPIGTAITRKGPQMTMKWGAQSLVDRIFAKHNVAGTLLLKRELALMSSAIWVQAQQAIVKKVKQEFAEDGIPVILDPTPFKFTQQEIVDHGEILTDDKDYTPAAAGDDHTLT